MKIIGNDCPLIFIGYDPRESEAAYVLSHSIQKRSSGPVYISFLNLRHLKSQFDRDWHKLQSTEFAFSRWLVPWLSGYQGWSLFMDCDMLMRADVYDLWDLRNNDYAVQVAKHDYTPITTTKFLNQPQTTYEKKNWSSVVLFNNSRCKKLDPNYVETATGLVLHQFKWLGNDNLIGDIPLEWNHLVGEYKYDEEAKNVHFTLGGPYFSEYNNCDYSQEWYNEKTEMSRVDQHDNL